MSVRFFGLDELANIGRALVEASRGNREEALIDVGARLALISKANARCYAYRYGGDVEPVEPALLVQRMRVNARVDFAQAAGDVGLLHYNCCEDRDFLAEAHGGLEALIRTLIDMLRESQRRAGYQ